MQQGVEILGWAGAASLLIAYGLTSIGRLQSEGGRFQVLNLAGATALALNSGYHSTWPSAALNLIWIAIGLGALLRAARRRGRRAAPEGAAAGGSPTDSG